MSRAVFVCLLVLACLQLVGIAFDSRTLIGLGAASAASPAPKVFTTRAGLESFSSEYVIVLHERAGPVRELRLTSERYAALRGPYNRRNPYGALLAFAPVLSHSPDTRDAFRAVARYALCDGAPLLLELGEDPSTLAPERTLVQTPREGTLSALPLRVEVTCDDG